MPTGYTAKISEGISFEEYALNCARAFGALITMRDEPSDSAIPEKFEPSDYNNKALEKTRQELAELEAMDSNEANRQASSAFVKAEEYRLKSLKDVKTLREKYITMLVQVDKWVSPTPDHDSYKTFMRDQITDSIRHDCGEDHYKVQTVSLTGEQWLSREILNAKNGIEYHSKQHDEEVARTNSRNSWVAALRESLGELKCF